MSRLAPTPPMIGFLVGAVLVVVTTVALFAGLGRELARTTPLATRGEQLYGANCASCHGGTTGGGMTDYPPKHNANGHTWHHPDCELKEVIRTGSSPMTEMMREMMAPPGAPTMPAWREKLTREEIDAVLAYIKTMWTPGQRDAQAEITQEECG